MSTNFSVSVTIRRRKRSYCSYPRSCTRRYSAPVTTTSSSRRLSSRTNMSGWKRSCQRESCIACGTTTWNSRSILPWRSARLRNRAVTYAASSVSVATISPDSASRTACIRISSRPSRSVTRSVSRFRAGRSLISGRKSFSRGSCRDATMRRPCSIRALCCVPQPASPDAPASAIRKAGFLFRCICPTNV